MGVRIRGPRLSKGEILQLVVLHGKCDAIIRMLRGTNWAGAQPATILVGEIDNFLCELYNKAERAMTANQEPRGPSSDAGQAEEIPPAPAQELARPPDPAVLEEEKIQRCI